jgi:2-C-methyl-D-erythritol 4-phosphate cytidylyltransferase
MQKAAIIVAGGTGTRMKTKLPKQFLPLRGVPVIVHTLGKFLDFDENLKIVLVLHAETAKLWEDLAMHYFSAGELKERIKCCSGGDERSSSVFNGLATLEAWVDDPSDCVVAIHDAVRPFVTREMLYEVYTKAELHGAAVCCVPVKSSVREITPEGSRSVERSRFLHVQTPQTFQFQKLLKAYSHRPHDNFTDDASLFEAMGGKVIIAQGSYDNLKLTTPEDIFVAENILRKADSR